MPNTNQADAPMPRRRGRPPGSTTGPTGPRAGSRPWALTRIEPGERIALIAPPGRSQAFMQQIAADICRVGLQGVLRQSLVIGVELATREVSDIVFITRVDSAASQA